MKPFVLEYRLPAGETARETLRALAPTSISPFPPCPRPEDKPLIRRRPMSTDPPPPAAPPALSDPLKRARRGPLLALNTPRLLDSSAQPPAPSRALDSSLKKHTTLLNKLRKGFSIDQKEGLIRDVEGLTLGKYVEEIVDACVEGVSGLGAKGDVLAVAEVRFHPLHTATCSGEVELSGSLVALLCIMHRF